MSQGAHAGGAGFDRKAFRRALGHFATGVTVITARIPGASGHVGITANSFNSVSLDPPLVLWSLERAALSLPVFEQAGEFVVNVLAADQVALSNRFAGRGQGDKFRGVRWREGLGGAPVLFGCAATFQCRRRLAHDGGDHVIFLGEVVEFADHGLPGLVYHRGAYAVSERHPVTDNVPVAEAGGGHMHANLGHLLARALACYQAGFDHILSRAGITRAEWQVLCALGDHRAGLSLDEIASAALLPLVPAARVLEGLVAAGLVDTVPQDGGVELQRLAARGEASLAPLLNAARAHDADALGSLSAADARRLRELLRLLPRPLQASRQNGEFLVDDVPGRT